MSNKAHHREMLSESTIPHTQRETWGFFSLKKGILVVYLQRVYNGQWLNKRYLERMKFSDHMLGLHWGHKEASIFTRFYKQKQKEGQVNKTIKVKKYNVKSTETLISPLFVFS